MFMSAIENTVPSQRISIIGHAGGSALQRDALPVHGYGAGENHNALNQAPHSGNHTERAAAQQRDQKLRNRLPGVSKIEIVNAEGAQQNAQNASGYLAFPVHVDRSGGIGRLSRIGIVNLIVGRLLAILGRLLLLPVLSLLILGLL